MGEEGLFLVILAGVLGGMGYDRCWDFILRSFFLGMIGFKLLQICWNVLELTTGDLVVFFRSKCSYNFMHEPFTDIQRWLMGIPY